MERQQMKLLYNRFLITADADMKATLPVRGHNGEYLQLDRRFDPMRHNTQIGTIAFIPSEFNSRSKDSHTLKPGDVIWFHHHVCMPKNRWLIKGEEYFQCGWEQIWAKVENEKLIPMNEWLFLSPIELDESTKYTDFGLQLRDDAGTANGYGIAFAVSEYGKELGINEGDIIHFVKDADYEIEIGGKTLWRMKLSSVVAIEREGKLIPLADKILIKEHEHEETVIRNGIQLPWSERDKQLYGIAEAVGSQIAAVKPGDEVVYYPGIMTRLTFNDQDYSIVRKEYIIYVK